MSRVGAVFAGVLGVLGFLVVVGSRALDPANIAWLGTGDSATHYLGWQFFRATPWAWPPGANPSYGLELGSSIVYSDSIPGLAFLFKLASGLLPETFQYFGLWLLACFVLQAVLGWKLSALLSERASVRILGAGLILFAPPFLWRVGIQSSLAAHWLVLAALYLNLRPRTDGRLFWWALVLCAAALVHAYLWAMVLALWLADFIARPERRPVLEPALMAGVASLTVWLCGYLVLPSDGVLRMPYGRYRMNLLSTIDPSGWSYLLPDLPQGPHDYDGFNFLGLGAILLVAAVLPRIWRARSATLPRRHWPLLAVLIVLACVALSNKLAVGSAEPVIIPLPEFVLDALSVFQSSGRFFWPVYYALLCWILWLVVSSFRHETALALLSAALLIQIVDTSRAWLPKREAMAVTGDKWPSSLNAPFWEAAAAKYRNVRWIPPNNMTRHWQELAYYAARHRMGTDAVYLARVSSASLAASRHRTVEALRTGDFEPDSLYVLDTRYVKRMSWKLRPGDLLAEIDGLTVLAPGWGASTIPGDGSESGQRP